MVRRVSMAAPDAAPRSLSTRWPHGSWAVRVTRRAASVLATTRPRPSTTVLVPRAAPSGGEGKRPSSKAVSMRVSLEYGSASKTRSPRRP
ncbi:hypothetical protein BE20_01355 [Sorangium cellulosum]|nr:hypothetical protein BE20_01355 [Sorangium cellulosum]